MELPALLADAPGPRPWKFPDGSFDGFEARYFHLGPGKHALEVTVATVRDRPVAAQVRELWKARQGRTASPLLLAVLHDSPDGARAWLCGPVGEDPPVYFDLDPSQAERIARAALQEPHRHAAIRFLVSVLPETETELPGLRNVGMFATHELKMDVPRRPDWASMTARGRTLLDKQGRELIEGLGFEIEARGIATSVLRIRDGGVATAIAIFLERKESPEATSARFPDASPVSTALAHADRENLRYVVLTRVRQIQIYGAGEIGVGRKGRARSRSGSPLICGISHGPPRKGGS
ncbi:MAG: hypothetical protein HY704_13500 [Gemmatimonadetes bacterium]|nr:hypothetical protein [Gemmatimonadota bacterium]